jgi:hypothetical protein
MSEDESYVKVLKTFDEMIKLNEERKKKKKSISTSNNNDKQEV